MSSQTPRRRNSKRPYIPWDLFRTNSQRPSPPSLDPTRPSSPGASHSTPPRSDDFNRPPTSPRSDDFNRPPTFTRSDNFNRPPSKSPYSSRPAPPRLVSPQTYTPYPAARPPAPPRRRKSCSLVGCLFSLLLLAALAVVSAAYLLWPGRTNVLLLGVDYADWWNWLSRTDTIMLTTWIPTEKYIGILSVPRDLWVDIPGVGANRINTAHFFCEASQPGSGPQCAIQTVQANFNVPFTYYVRVRFEGFKDVVNALGGVDITLKEDMAGYAPGSYHLTGNKALAFVRARFDSDDFHRMEHGQFMLKALVKTILKPTNWLKFPAVVAAVLRNVDTNLPRWLWPRFAFTLLVTGPDGIDNRVIKGDMVVPFTTNEGAAVLAPNWQLINPILLQMFYGK